MRSFLIRKSPFDAIARWWYILLIGPVLGLCVAFATDISVLPIPVQKVSIAEGPPSSIASAQLKVTQNWKEKVLFAVFGGLFAGFMVYLLEDIRKHLRYRP